MVVKAPVLDDGLVRDQLCPWLSLYFSKPCRLVFQSTTASYYGIDASDFGYSRISEIIPRDLDAFTASCKLLCGSTVTVTVDSIARLRYKASPRSCSASV